MSAIGSVILIAVGCVFRFAFADPDMPSLYDIGIIFVACGLAGLAHDAYIGHRRAIAVRSTSRPR